MISPQFRIPSNEKHDGAETIDQCPAPIARKFTFILNRFFCSLGSALDLTDILLYHRSDLRGVSCVEETLQGHY